MNRYALAALPSLIALAACTTTVTPPAAPGCAPDSSVAGCSGNSFGYSCGNGDSPERTNSSLVCSDGVVASDGFTLFCCIQFTSTSCAPDSSVSGCQGSSFGFSCTGSDTPDDADSSLTCSSPTQGGDGSLLYCCQ
jgi:hypothetical protein